MEYCKINTIYKRDERGKIIEHDYATPEFDYLASNQWTWTEKVDGTNTRVYWDGEKVTFGGRTDSAQMPMVLINRLDELFRADDSKRLRSALPTGGYVLYGEGHGAKIQKGGGRYSATPEFVLFDVLAEAEDSDGSKIWLWLSRENVVDIGHKLAIDVVPLVGKGTLLQAAVMAQQGFNSDWGNFPAEGLVMRPETELRDRRGKRVIAKIKTRDFA